MNLLAFGVVEPVENRASTDALSEAGMFKYSTLEDKLPPLSPEQQGWLSDKMRGFPEIQKAARRIGLMTHAERAMIAEGATVRLNPWPAKFFDYKEKPVDLFDPLLAY